MLGLVPSKIDPIQMREYRRTHEASPLAMHMSEEQQVAAYFDLDGTLLNASSEKTLTRPSDSIHMANEVCGNTL